MFKSLVLCTISGLTLFFVYIFYQENLGSQSNHYKEYRESIKILNKWLEENTDSSQKHFQPCRTCGYELALVHDNSYCLKSDLHKLLHPEIVETDFMVFRDYGGNDLARKIIGAQMYDAIPGFVQTRNMNGSKFELPLETSVLYPYAKNYFRTHPIGRQGGCIFQKYYHVPGQEELALKSNLSTHFHNYIGKLTAEKKSEKCIKDASFEKPTFRMWLKSECTDFFRIVNSAEYQAKNDAEGLQYIYKTNRHLGNGILLVNEENTKLLRDWYQDGNGCGVNITSVIVQEYIKNPYLYKGHKMEFRSYFAIASTSPSMLFGYRKALIKQCAYTFDLKDFTKETHVCNTAVTKTLNDKNDKLGHGNDDDLYIDWNLEELQDLLLEQGRINSTNWLNEYLYPQIMRKITHLYFSVDKYMFKDSRVGEFFGVDFIMDDNLVLWILECNRNPNFLAVTEGRKEKFGKLIPNMLELEMQLFILKKLIPAISQGNVQKQINLKHEFLLLMNDKYEPEFQLSQDNLAILAYVEDAELAKSMNYTSLIDKDCIENSRKSTK